MIGSNTLLLCDETRNTAVDFPSQPLLGGYARKSEHKIESLRDREVGRKFQRPEHRDAMRVCKMLGRQMLQGLFEWKIDQHFTISFVAHDEATAVGHFTDEGYRTAFALRDCRDDVTLISPND